MKTSLRKVYLPLFILLLIGLLSGCLTNKKNYQDAVAGLDQVLYEQKIGILTPKENNDSGRGSHVLTLDSGQKIWVESKFFDLNLPKYLYNKVEVRGPYLTGENQENDWLQVEQITVLEELSKTPVIGNIWQTY